MVLDAPAQKNLCGLRWKRTRHVQSPLLVVLGVHSQTPQKLLLLLDYLKQLQTSHSGKQGICIWKPFLWSSAQEFIKVTLSPFDQTCWSTWQHSPGPASYLGKGLVRTHLPSLLVPTSVFLPVGRDRGGEKGQAGVFLGLTQNWSGSMPKSRPSNSFLWRVSILCVLCINHPPPLHCPWLE